MAVDLTKLLSKGMKPEDVGSLWNWDLWPF